MAETYLLAMRGPVQRRRDSNPGFRTELENLTGDGKGKGTSGSPARPKVPKHRLGSDCSIVVEKRGNARGAKGAGDPCRGRNGSTVTPEVSQTGRNAHKLREFLPMPWMRPVALPDPACIPTRDTNS